MNRREAAIISAYTGILLGSFDAFHEYAEELLNRPVWTHEFGDEKVMNEIQERSEEDFLTIAVSLI